MHGHDLDVSRECAISLSPRGQSATAAPGRFAGTEVSAGWRRPRQRGDWRPHHGSGTLPAGFSQP